MIIWGSGGDVVNLGEAGTQHCGICERERSFNYLLHYRYFHLYWVFGLITEKEYLLLCEVCRRGWKLDAQTVEQKLGKHLPVPWMRQYGLPLLLCGVFGLPLILSLVEYTSISGLVVLAIVALAVAGFWFYKRRLQHKL